MLVKYSNRMTYNRTGEKRGPKSGASFLSMRRSLRPKRNDAMHIKSKKTRAIYTLAKVIIEEADKHGDHSAYGRMLEDMADTARGIVRDVERGEVIAETRHRREIG